MTIPETEKNMIDHALSYARIGWPVFPCNADKTPKTPNGVRDATCDEKKIKSYWGLYPNANIGVNLGQAGLMAVDLDPGHDLAELAEAAGELKTFCVQRTPRGGSHLIFRLAEGEVVQPSASKIARNVDIRSNRSYILLHPSVTSDGGYSWLYREEPAFRPDKLFEACRSSRHGAAGGKADWTVTPDDPANVQRAIQWLERDAEPAVEGRGGDAKTYATAAYLRSLGVSESTALELMLDHYNPRCLPEWTHEQLETKTANAYRYAVSPPGNLTPQYQSSSIKSLFGPVNPCAGETGGGESTQPVSGRFRFTDRQGLDSIRPPDMLIPDFLPEKAYALLIGPPSAYKTFLAVDIALSIATGGGFPWEGLWGDIQSQGPVLFAAGEGRANLIQRVKAWEKLHVDGNPVHDFILADPIPWVNEDLSPFIAGALALRPSYRLIVLDTVSRAMQGVNENAQEHASNFSRMVETLIRATGATVLALHHTGHGASDRARGSSVFGADADTIIQCERNGRFVSITMKKQKDLPEWEKPRYAEMRPVNLGAKLSSLAVVKSAPPPEDLFSKEHRHDEMMDITARKIEGFLMDRPLKAFSARSLADALQADLGIDSWTLRNKLMKDLTLARHDVTRLFDPETRRWVFKPSQDPINP